MSFRNPFRRGSCDGQRILNLLEKMMATQEEFLALVNGLTTEVTNIATAVQALVTAQAASGNTTPAEDAAVAGLKTALDNLSTLANPPAAAPAPAAS